MAIGTKANPEEILTMAAFFCLTSIGVNSAQSRIGATRFTAISSSFGRGGFIGLGEAKSCCRWIPALLTKMLKSLKLVSTQRESFCRSISLETSSLLVRILGRFRFASCSFRCRLPQIMTWLSSSRNASANASPIPVAPPVIKIVFPAVFNGLHLCPTARGDKFSSV